MSQLRLFIGGVGILVDNKVATDAKLKFATERYIIVQLHDLVFINVYLPCASVANLSLIHI